MDTLRRYVAPILLLLALAACGGEKSPAAPSTPAVEETRIIRLEANLDFGDVEVGASLERTLRIYNHGTAPLTVTGMTGPVPGYVANWTSGVIPAGGNQGVTIAFRPTAPRAYTGTLTVQANHTSGSNALPITGTGVAEIWTRSGVGNQVFDMPTYITRVRIQGTWNRTGNSNFIVRVGGSLELNEILRDVITYDGTHLVTGGVVEIVSSGNIAWTFTELR